MPPAHIPDAEFAAGRILFLKSMGYVESVLESLLIKGKSPALKKQAGNSITIQERRTL